MHISLCKYKLQMVSEHKKSSISAFYYSFGYEILVPQKREEIASETQ